jgi:hypothetical protein
MAALEYDEHDVQSHRGNRRIISWLMREGFLYDSMRCERCLTPMLFQHSPSFSIDHWCWRCPRERCRSRISVRDGSFFSGSHLTLRELILIVINFAAESSILGTARRLRISREVVGEFFKKIKEAYSRELVTDPITLDHGFEYEVDEVYIKHVEVEPDTYQNQWVASIYERSTGRIIYYRVDDRSSLSLIPPIILKLPGGVFIYSDDWRSYRALDTLMYVHRYVNHSNHEFSRVEVIAGQEITVSINNTEGINHVVRQKLSNKSSRTAENLDLVLSEIAYRRSGRSLFSPIKV